jgi:PAS domain S-box-containing protein
MNKGEAQGYAALSGGGRTGPGADAQTALDALARESSHSGGSDADLRLLAALTQWMRLSSDADELVWLAVQAIGRHLQLTRCSLNEVDEAADAFRVHRDYRDPADLPSATGVYPLSAYPPEVMRCLSAGHVVVVSDTLTDPSTAPFHVSAYEPLSVRAFVAVPLSRRGRWVSALGAAYDRPHVWTARELTILTTLAEHVWNALEKERLDAHLRDSERRFKGLTSHAPVGIFETDATGNCLFVNEKWCSLAGLTADAARERGWVSALHPEDRDRVFFDWYEAAHSGQEFAGDYRFCTPDGTVSWVKGSAVALRDAAGQVTGYIGTVTDITQRKLSEQSSADLAHKLQLVTDSLPALISYVDADGRYQFNNRAYVDWFGHECEKIQGNHMRDVLGTAAFTKLEDYVRRALSGQHVEFEERVPYRDGGTRCIHAQYVPDVRADRTVAGFYALITDITQRRDAEEHTQELLREVNHRAKNMLAVVQAVARQTATDEDPKIFAERFSARLAGLAVSQELLVQSDWRGADLDRLIRSQLAHLDALVDRRIFLEGGPIRVSAAAAHTIGMVVHELSTNAAKYGSLSSRTGEVRITWSLAGIGDDARFAMAWVECNGPSVAPPRRKGFGHSVMVQTVEHALDADVELNYLPEGIEWRLSAPASAVLEGGSLPANASQNA